MHDVKIKLADVKEQIEKKLTTLICSGILIHLLLMKTSFCFLSLYLMMWRYLNQKQKNMQ